MQVEIDTGDAKPVACAPRRFAPDEQRIIGLSVMDLAVSYGMDWAVQCGRLEKQALRRQLGTAG